MFIEFKKWLDNLLKEYLTPIANIIAKQEKKPKVSPCKANTNAGTIDRKSKDKQKVWWFCNQPHRPMECEKFIKKNLQEKKVFVLINKLCGNCSSKVHFVKQCNSKYRCKNNKFGKHHHSLLHETEPPDKKHPQENKSQTLTVLVNSHYKSKPSDMHHHQTCIHSVSCSKV